jgi:NAD-dependent dihydropyrimidine dehydrogenase PreA subunit
MAENLLTVVVSQGQSRNPEKRDLEKAIADTCAKIPGVNVLVIPHLYDLAFDSETYQKLRSIDGDMVVLAWLYDRAAHWVLDRNAVRGQVGEVFLLPADYQADEEDEDEDEEASDEKDRVAALNPRPNRTVYCVDLRASEDSTAFVQEVKRIAAIAATKLLQSRPELSRWIEGTPTPDNLLRYLNPVSSVQASDAVSTSATESIYSLFGANELTKVEEHPTRRWYPVIDFSRCTNCMECIDFCLFGVYGVDTAETILVEQPDNCRKGCPACSRVCPENAIIFPQHKTPAIAGAPVEVGGLKIDLSKLFGAPESNEDAMQVAARERDEQLILAGRQAVGEVRTKSNASTKSDRPKDELDNLLDQLDSLDL